MKLKSDSSVFILETTGQNNIQPIQLRVSQMELIINSLLSIFKNYIIVIFFFFFL